MPRTVNVNYVTKEVKILLHDSETESLAAATAIAAAASAQEAKDVVVDNLQDSLDAIDAKTETEKTELDNYTDTKKTEISSFATEELQPYVTAAATSAQAADTTATALTTFLETKETLTAPAVDSTLSVSGAAADAKVTGDYIHNVKLECPYSFVRNGYINRNTNKWMNVNSTSATAGKHIAVQVSAGDKIKVVANASQLSPIAFLKTYNLVNGSTADFSEVEGYTSVIQIELFLETTVPADTTYLYFYAGSTENQLPREIWINGYKVSATARENFAELFSKTDGTDDLLWLERKPYGNGDNGLTYTLDLNKNEIAISGTTTSSLSYYRMYYSHQYIPYWLQKGKKYIAHIDTDDENVTFDVFEFYNNSSSYSVLASTNNIAEFTVSENATGVSFRIAVVGDGVSVDTVVKPYITECYTAEELDAKVDKLTNKEQNVSLKILAIGNSFSQDNLSYAPFILQNVINMDLTIGISYIGGASINTQINSFNSTSKHSFNLFKTSADSTRWKNYSKTMKNLLIAEDWDIILFQQASDYQEDWSSYANLGTLLTDVLDYVSTDHEEYDYKGHPVKLGWLMPQLKKSIETEDSYANDIQCIQNILDQYPIDHVFPCGTAIQNARGTSLAQYGDGGNMTTDGAHLQEGIGCMVGSYTSSLCILNLAGVFKKSILGDNTRPDLQWLTDKNIQGQNLGSGVVGISDENCRIAQKCAVAAIKKPFAVSTII